jgi:ReqiPepy6 Gp37-like protein
VAELLDEGGAILYAEGGLDPLLEEGEFFVPAPPPAEVRSVYSIDLCVGWVRVAECVDGVFDGVIRNLAKGEWRLTGAVAGLIFEGAYTLADVDTVRVVRDAQIVFPGYVSPIVSGVGALQITGGVDGEQFSLTGPDAWDVLTSRVAYPTPSTGPPWADSHDIRTGVASTVAAGYILANAGSSATADRQIPGLTVVDGSAGTTGSWSARLQLLEQLVVRVCQDGGLVCRLTVDFDGDVEIELGNPRDRRATTVLSDQGDLTNIQTIVTPEETTFVIAGGQGNLTARTFATAGSATGAVRREVFSNQSSLSTSTELQQSANTTLALAASTLTVRAELTDAAAERLQYLEDYEVGDIISAEIGVIRYPVIVQAVTFHVSPQRSVIRPVLGDAAPDLLTGLIRDVAGLQSRFDTQIS